MKYLYIAEKASAMQAVKSAYEKSSKPLGEIRFVALSGHVCGLLEPKEYKQWENKRWEDYELPLIPEDFKVKETRKDIVKNIRTMLKSEKFDGIIVGTDSDVEGNGIYALLEKELHLEKFPAYRFFETSLTDKDIMESFKNLTDFHKEPRDVGMTQAFWVRAEFDWLVGNNLTIAYTVKTNMTMRVGRVKAPTLKLVYDNCEAIDNFQTKKSYLPVICTDNPALTATLIDEEKKDLTFDDQKIAQGLIDQIGDTAVVKEIEKKEQKRPPQQLYKLTNVQVEAGQKYGYSPEKTLQILQSLYETHKVMSYPRTDGRYVSSEKAKEFKSLLKAVAAIPELKDVVDRLTDSDISAAAKNKRFVNDAEVKKTSHDALIPTGKIPELDKMSVEERNICTMVYKRFLAIFLPDLIEEKTRYVLEADGNLFVCKGSVVLKKGFTEIFDTKIKELKLPDVDKGQNLHISQKGLHEVVAKPPQRYTQATLLDAMENIQKYITDAQMKAIMKEAHGIGQPSSRAKIISDLIKTGYMEEKKGKGLYITAMGKAYIEYLKGHSIVDPVLSAQWELHLKNIREGSEKYEDVMEQVLGYVEETVSEVEKQNLSKYENKEKNNHDSICSCPLCGGDILKYKWGYGCSNYKNGCGFSIGKISGKLLSESQVKKLIQNHEVGPIKNFKKKDGGSFEAKLKLLIAEDGKKAEIKFDFPDIPQVTDELDEKCPYCGGNMENGRYGWVCSNKCGLEIPYKIGREHGKSISSQLAKTLLILKKTEFMNDFVSKEGKPFTAALELKDKKVKLVFPDRSEGKDNVYVKCPDCGCDMVRGQRGWECEKHCGIMIPYELCKKPIDAKLAETLLIHKKTGLLDGFIGKKGNPFVARLVLSGKDIKFEFPKR